MPLSAASVVKTAKGGLVGGVGGRLVCVRLFLPSNAPLDASALINKFISWNDVAKASGHGHGQCHGPTPRPPSHAPSVICGNIIVQVLVCATVQFIRTNLKQIYLSAFCTSFVLEHLVYVSSLNVRTALGHVANL